MSQEGSLCPPLCCRPPLTPIHRGGHRLPSPACALPGEKGRGRGGGGGPARGCGHHAPRDTACGKGKEEGEEGGRRADRELYGRVCMGEETMCGHGYECTCTLYSSLQEETFSIPESSTPSSEAPSTSILPSDGIISEWKGTTLSYHDCLMVSLSSSSSLSGPMSESTVSPELGPSPTTVFSPEPVHETTSGTSPDHTSTAFASSGLGPEPTVVRSASPVSLGPEPVSLSPEPGSNRASPGPEPVPLPLEPTRTAEEEEEEEEEEEVIPLSSGPVHTEDKTMKEERQERKEDKEERRKKVKEGRKGKEGRKIKERRKEEEEDKVAAKPPAAQVEEQKTSSSGKHYMHV